MNERIQTLAEKATQEFSSAFERDKWLEKFAEMIMKECISVPYDMWDKAELNADIAVKIEHRIKEHFGVQL
jgi:chorismate mutase